jgi:Uma2 family endonuclease
MKPTKNSIREQEKTDNYSLVIEITSTEKRNNDRKLLIEKVIDFESMEDLKEYTKRNNILYKETDILRDLRNNNIMVMAYKKVSTDLELKEYYNQLETDIKKLKK